MEAKEYLEMALGGNMNISTFTVSAWCDILESYAKLRIKESGQPEMLEVIEMINEQGYEFCGWSEVEKILTNYK